MSDGHPSERWMWGREAAIGTRLYWNIHHKVLRSGKWVPDIPYSCGDESFAIDEAAKMRGSRASDGRDLYRDVTVSGPHVSWREVWWKYRDDDRRKT